MSHRTRRSVVSAPWLLGLIAVVGVGQPGAAQPTDDLIIRIGDVETLARSGSPRLRVAALEIDAVQAERRSALAWTNPALAFDHERVGSNREWQLTLQKRIDRPLARGALRAAWDGRVRAAELRASQATRDLLAELKTGYVRVRLIQAQLDGLERLADLVGIAADVAASRHAEGELSGLDSRLIRLAAYTLEAARNRSRSEHALALAAWRADMGLEASRRLILATPIAFRPVEPGLIGNGPGDPAAMPGVEAQVELARALGFQAEAARPGSIPGFEVFSGYKRSGPDLDGFVAGVAVDLPLFAAGRGEADRLQAERMAVENALTADRMRRQGQIAALAASLRAAQPLLAGFDAEFAQDPPADALLASYREGAITLDELLGAVQVEAAAIEAHHADLATYYENVFRLEALTGARLVDFAP